jgi:hypothetical protein
MIPMSAEEIKQFWHGFCERQRIKSDVRAEGDRRIEADPDFWADQTMWQLVEAISGEGGRKSRQDE